MNQIMCIGANTLKDILNHMGAIDFKHLTLAIVSVEMTTVDTASVKYKNNPEHKLVRHEFFEFLVRAADTKLHKSGQVPTLGEAMEVFYENYCKEFFQKQNP